MKYLLKQYLSYVVLAVFSLSFLKFAYADAWGNYQAVKAANRAQNQANMQQFKNGNMSAQDLEKEWDRIAREEHEAAKKVEDEWKKQGDKRQKDAREKYEKDKKKQDEEAAKRKKDAEQKMKKDKEEMDRKARETREKYEKDQKEEEERARRAREEYEKRKSDPNYWEELNRKWREDYEKRMKIAGGPSGRDMLVATGQGMEGESRSEEHHHSY